LKTLHKTGVVERLKLKAPSSKPQCHNKKSGQEFVFMIEYINPGISYQDADFELKGNYPDGSNLNESHFSQVRP
jgi:hypothetical protein